MPHTHIWACTYRIFSAGLSMLWYCSCEIDTLPFTYVYFYKRSIIPLVILTLLCGQKCPIHISGTEYLTCACTLDFNRACAYPIYPSAGLFYVVISLVWNWLLVLSVWTCCEYWTVICTECTNYPLLSSSGVRLNSRELQKGRKPQLIWHYIQVS